MRRLLLAIYLLGSSCTSVNPSAPAQASNASLSEPEPRTARAPTVLTIGSKGTCGAGTLTHVVAADRKRLEAAMSAQPIAATPTAIKEATDKASETAGLIVFFTGHGQDSGANSESELCMDDDSWLSVTELIGWLDQSPAPWSVLVLSSCSSAYVDLRVATHRPISVISASPHEVGTAQQRTNYVSDLVDSLVKVYEGGADLNCDGFLDDREWFTQAAAKLGRSGAVAASSYPPVPRWRSQARAEQPLWPIDVVSTDCRRIREGVLAALSGLRPTPDENALADGECGQDLVAQLTRQWGRTNTESSCSDVDYFYVPHEPRLCEPGQETAAADQPLLQLCGASPQLRPLPVVSGAEPTQQTIEALARYATFTAFYQIERSGRWVRARRMSDQFIVGVRPVRNIAGLIPGRSRVLSRWKDGTRLVRFSRGYWPKLLQLQHTSELMTGSTVLPAACPDEEGQCYLAIP